MLLPPPTPAGPRQPRNVVIPLFKDLPKLVLVFALVLGAAGAGAAMLKPRYDAQALLYVKFGREYAWRSETGGAETAPQNFEAKQVLKAEARILNARELAAQVVERLGVAALYPDLLERPGARWPSFLPPLGAAWSGFLPAAAKLSPEAAATKRFVENMHTEAGEDGHIIAVSFAHPDAATATRALDALIAAYLERRRTLFTDQRAASLQPEVEEAQARMAAAEAALTAYRARHKIVSFDAQRAQLLERRATAQARLADADVAWKGLADRLQRLQETLGKTPATLVLETSSGDSAALDNARQTLLQLRLEERRLLAEYQEKSPFVVEVRQRLAQAERFVAEVGKRPRQSMRQGRNPVYDTLATQIATVEGDLAAAESRRAVLRQQFADAGDDLLGLDARTAEMARLTREHELAEAGYRLLAAKLEETRVLDQVAARDDANVRVAQAPRAPVEPRDLRPLVLALGVVAAFVAALLTAFLSNLLRRGFLTTEDLAREIGLPVLAALPVRRIRPWSPRLSGWEPDGADA